MKQAIIAVFVAFVLASCSGKLLDSKRYADVRAYQYAIVAHTDSVNGGSGSLFGGSGAAFGYGYTKSVSPRDLISGILINKGFIVVENAPAQNTLVVRYGQIEQDEVVIQMLDYMTSMPVFMCRASGGSWGETQADTIRDAIQKCLSVL